MAYFLFIDESGQDHRDSPYEVLAGVAVEDRDIWNLITEINEAEMLHFGTKYTLPVGAREIKARKFLGAKVYKKAQRSKLFEQPERTIMARTCLINPKSATDDEIAALAQAKIAYSKEILKICLRFRCRVFGAIIRNDYKKTPQNQLLRKDYVYLFERFYYFLEDKIADQMGIVVFDELEKSQSHILIGQMENYFKKTDNGRLRSNKVIPEPLFVHSDLSTGIRIADFLAYILSWGFRVKSLDKPARTELGDLVDIIKRMRYRTVREINSGQLDHEIWSIVPVELK